MGYTSTKNIEVKEDQVLTGYTPSEKEADIVSRVTKRLDDMKRERDKARDSYDGRTLKQYIDDNMNQWNGIVPSEVKDAKKPWQSLIYDHITRGKVKAVVALTTGNAPYINIIGQTEKYKEQAAQVKALFDFEWQTRNERYKNYLQGLSAANKGTVIVEEFYKEERYTRKKITNINQETGEMEFEEEQAIRDGYGHVDSQIIPLLEFYPNENYSDIKEDCAVAEYFTESAFEAKYGKYKNAEHVKTGSIKTNPGEETYTRLSTDKDSYIEVVKYYNEIFDQFVLLANGIWINPQKGDAVAPIPYNHKKLPFTKSVYELADESEFYGKALPDLMTGEQETINAVLRLMVDKEILALNRPMLAGLSAELDSYDIAPGVINTTSSDINQIKEMDIKELSQAPFSLLEFMAKRSNINTGIDPMASGAASGGRKTLGEVEVLDENAKRVAGSFQLFIFKLLRERAKLRVSNIQQFYKDPVNKEILDKAEANGEAMPKKEFREFTVEKNGFEPEYKKVDPEKLEGDFVVLMQEDFFEERNSARRQSTAMKMLIEAKNNPLLNIDSITLEWLKSMNKNPDNFYKRRPPKQVTNQNEETNNAAVV